MEKEIKLGLVYRDMWQSSGKYVPTVDQLIRVAGPIIDMGCFSRVETNGGGFEQINLLFGENPNKAVRAWTKPFNEAGIQTHMLERGLNGLRMSPVPADVRKLMFKVKKKQGTDISRSFDGLNDIRNLENSIRFAKEGGMIAQGTLSITYSKVHTVEYYIKMADDLIEMGAQEICIKDMAGVGRPVSLGKIVKGIKQRHPAIPVTYHSHAGPGFSVASILEVSFAGVDYVDVAMEPLSWGTGHADLLTVHEMLKDAGFKLKPVDMKAYMKVRSLTQEFMDDFLGYFISDKNRLMNSLLIGPGLPGGMMGSLMADLENNLASLNKWFEKNNQPTITQDDLLIKLFDEVQFIWPKMGYPPLVTPYSQYVKNIALMNVMQMAKGKERWSMIDENTWDMLLGKAGKVPGPIAPELIEMAKSQGKEFYEGNPQDLYKDKLPQFKEEMDKNGWDYGQDDEELFELAMHPEQYRAYKSGKAKKDFEEEIAGKKKAEKSAPVAVASAPSAAVSVPASYAPKTLNIDVNGEKYHVTVSYDQGNDQPAGSTQAKTEAVTAPAASSAVSSGAVIEIISPLEGKFFLTKSSADTAKKVGDVVKEGEIMGYIESMKVYNAITADKSGKIVEVCLRDGESVVEDDVLFKLQ